MCLTRISYDEANNVEKTSPYQASTTNGQPMNALIQIDELEYKIAMMKLSMEMKKSRLAIISAIIVQLQWIEAMGNAREMLKIRINEKAKMIMDIAALQSRLENEKVRLQQLYDNNPTLAMAATAVDGQEEQEQED